MIIFSSDFTVADLEDNLQCNMDMDFEKESI